MPQQLLKAAGIGKTIKEPFKRLQKLLFGTKQERIRMGDLRRNIRFADKAEEEAVRSMRSKYRRRQALAALGLTGAASSPLVYKALKKPDATR
jgi:hypothetical protein